MSGAATILGALAGCMACGGARVKGYVFCKSCLHSETPTRCPYCGKRNRWHPCGHLLRADRRRGYNGPFKIWQRSGFQHLETFENRKVWVPKLEPRYWESKTTSLPPEFLRNGCAPLPLQPLEHPIRLACLMAIFEERDEVYLSLAPLGPYPWAHWARDPGRLLRQIKETSNALWDLCLEVEALAGGVRANEAPKPGWEWFWLPDLKCVTAPSEPPIDGVRK